MVYQTGALSNDAMSVLQSGGVQGDLNLPKDLSLLNRRGYASTTRKGVPLVYKCKIDFYLHDEDGVGPSTAGETASGSALAADLQGVLVAEGCQNNWVMRNAAVKWHAAMESMYREAGVRKADRGAYSHEIRYGYDAAADQWLVPIDGNGDAFTGGTWDLTTLSYQADAGFGLILVGDGDDEDTNAFSGGHLSIGHSYLVSRANQEADTNLESEEGPAEFSVLNTMLKSATDTNTTTAAAIREAARNDQDNPPYEVLDLSSSGDVSHDITEPVELGRAVAGYGNVYGSTIVEIPFGLAKLTARVHDANDTAINPSCLVCVEVLDIFEMQG